MSKQDTHFLNVFSVVIGLLIVITVCLFALARYIGTTAQAQYVSEDEAYIRHVQGRVESPAHEAVAGQDNSSLSVAAPATAAATAAPAAAGGAPAAGGTGKDLFEQTCSACHGLGVAGAPKAGDAAAWGPRIAQGKATLYEHALKGFQGKSGVMPAKGGRTDAPDKQVQQAVDYMVSLVK